MVTKGDHHELFGGCLLNRDNDYNVNNVDNNEWVFSKEK